MLSVHFVAVEPASKTAYCFPTLSLFFCFLWIHPGLLVCPKLCTNPIQTYWDTASILVWVDRVWFQKPKNSHTETGDKKRENKENKFDWLSKRQDKILFLCTRVLFVICVCMYVSASVCACLHMCVHVCVCICACELLQICVFPGFLFCGTNRWTPGELGWIPFPLQWNRNIKIIKAKPKYVSVLQVNQSLKSDSTEESGPLLSDSSFFLKAVLFKILPSRWFVCKQNMKTENKKDGLLFNFGQQKLLSWRILDQHLLTILIAGTLYNCQSVYFTAEFANTFAKTTHTISAWRYCAA